MSKFQYLLFAMKQSILRHRRQNVRNNFYIIALSFIFYLIKNHKQE